MWILSTFEDSSHGGPATVDCTGCGAGCTPRTRTWAPPTPPIPAMATFFANCHISKFLYDMFFVFLLFLVTCFSRLATCNKQSLNFFIQFFSIYHAQPAASRQLPEASRQNLLQHILPTGNRYCLPCFVLLIDNVENGFCHIFGGTTTTGRNLCFIKRFYIINGFGAGHFPCI